MTTNDDLKELLLNFQSDLSQKIDKMEKELRKLRSENAKVTNDILTHNLKYRELKVKNKNLEMKLEVCKNKIDFLMNREKGKNLELFKVKDNPEKKKN